MCGIVVTKKHEDPACMLREIANTIGMDCAFSLKEAALGEHFGEKITYFPRFCSIACTINDTSVKISSKNAYNVIDRRSCGKDRERQKPKNYRSTARTGRRRYFKNIHNDFEPFYFRLYPELAAQKTRLEKKGGRTLCGSGGALAHIVYS